MSLLPHLRIEGDGKPEDYVYAGGGGSVTFDRPKRNQPAHAKKVRQELTGIDAALRGRRAEDESANPGLIEYRADGAVLTFRSDPDHELSLDRLERNGAKIELLSVKVVDGVQVARVFVPEGGMAAFLKLVDAYSASVVLTYAGDPKDEAALVACEEPAYGIKLRKPVRRAKVEGADRIKVKFVVAEAEVARFKEKIGTSAVLLTETREHDELVDSIASVRLAIAEDCWQDTLEFPQPDEEIWWEFWLRGSRSTAEAVHRRFAALAAVVGISRVSQLHVAFPERVVVHARATPKQVSSSVDLLAMIGELRKGKELATYYANVEAAEQADFVADALKKLVPPREDAPCVCVLDGGVNRAHPLLEPALAEADQHAAKDEWGVSDHDPHQHGTGMAGLALYGCLTEVMQATGAIRLGHKIESVKIMPPPPAQNDPPDYGRRMQDGVALAHVWESKRNRAICMAVTTPDHRDGGMPSLWSAAVDDLCSGGFDGARRLMFISAGNMRDEILKSNYVYHDWNRTLGGVEDPAQAWNALAVGAYTEKVDIRHESYKGWTPVAESGDLCPTSRTSLAWPPDRQGGWPIKPDLVMEGGNYVRRGGPPLGCDDLSLLTTCIRDGRLLTTMRDTSPATALAARLAAVVWSRHPKLRPETVRALLVHSAQWTPAMRARFPGGRRGVLQRLRCYGYGVPSLQRALHSAENAVTMIYEGELRPFRKEGSEVKTNHMNVHELPWPTAVLEDLGEERVSMRATLSYFVEPSPSRVGWGVNHRYASHGLRFDVVRPTESKDDFRKRISRAFWDGPKARPANAKETRDWVVGEDARSLGSLHSDWWSGTAATLARSGKIVVYPVSGWWRERKHLQRYDHPARYSLLVSIRSRRTGVDLYTPIINAGAVQAEVIG